MIFQYVLVLLLSTLLGHQGFAVTNSKNKISKSIKTTFPNHVVLENQKSLPHISDEQFKNLRESKEWRRLLYYKKTRFGSKSESEVANPKFFISKNGRSNPEQELAVSLKAFFNLQVSKNSSSSKKSDLRTDNFTPSNIIDDNHPICQFPARFYWLNKKLHLNQMNLMSHCKSLNEFMSRINGQSVSMVFSSYFISNPSSAFGHTFLKVNKSNDYELDLLNYGINYAATVDTKNTFFYIFKGLMGFFPGEFTAVPYHYKVREYNDYESRDLWEYKLNLTPEEILLLNLHIWELGKGWSWYYFFDKNCSYWAIRVLEAIKPDLDLTPRFGNTFVIPIETVKSLFSTSGLVTDVKFRPSLRQQLLTKVQKIKSSDFKEMNKVVDNIEIEDTDYSKHTYNFLETSVLLYDFKNAKNLVHREDTYLKKKQPILNALSLMTTEKHPTPQVNIKNAPHKSHPPKRLSLGYKNQNFKNTLQRSGVNLDFKAGFHEILDSSRGFNAHMGLNYFDFSFLIFNEQDENSNSIHQNKFILDSFNLISIDAFSPINRIESHMSWRLRAGIDSEQYLKDWSQKSAYLTYDSGWSKAFFENEDLLLFFLASNTLEANGRYEYSLRYGLAPLLGLKYAISMDTQLILEIKPLWVTDFKDINYVTQSSLKFRRYVPNFNLGLTLEAQYLDSSESSNLNFASQINYYF